MRLLTTMCLILGVLSLSASPLQAQPLKSNPTTQGTDASPAEGDAPAQTSTSTPDAPAVASEPVLDSKETAAAAAALNKDALTLELLQRSLDQWHPEIERQRALIQQAQAAQLEAQGAFDTSVGSKGFWNPWAKNYGWLDLGVKQPTPLWGATVEAGWRIGLGAIPVYKLDYDTVSPGGELYAAVAVPLWRDGPIDARRLKIAQTELKTAGARQEMRLARQNLGLEAVEAYFKWVAMGMGWQIELELLKLATDRNEGLIDRVRRGDLPEIALVDNQRAIYKRRGSAASAERKFIEASIKLSIYWRDGKGQPLLPTQQQLPTLDSLMQAPIPISQLTRDADAATRTRPELRALELKQRQLEAERDWADNQLAPQVDLQAGVTKSLVPETFNADTKSELFLGLQVQLYLQQSKARGQRDMAEAGLLELDAKGRLTRDKLVAELSALHAAQRIAYEQREQAKLELVAAKRLEEAERERLSLGDSTWLIVNIREQNSADAAKRLVQYQTDYAEARARYLWLRGSQP